MAFELNGKTYETDEEGYLADLSQWDTEAAAYMAKEDECDLDENHWKSSISFGNTTMSIRSPRRFGY